MPQPSHQPTSRKLIPGEVLLKPGTRVQCVYIIQSGCIAVCHAKGERMVEIARYFSPSSLCDEAVFGSYQWKDTAIAVRDTVVLEIPVPLMQQQLKASNQILPLLVKGLAERSKVTFADLKALKSNAEVLPCPGDETAKLFGVIFHSARILSGAAKDNLGTPAVEWAELMRFAWEVFEEAPSRLEDGITILVKLGYARVSGSKVEFLEMNQIESFFDYFGNYHFKGGYAELLKTNSKATKVTEAFLEFASRHPVDRGGYAHLPYTETVDAMKKALGKTFEADQLFRLEQKGLFIKRTATQNGGVLSFYKPDFTQMLLNWKILRELEIWNETGYVEPAQGAAGMPADAGTAPADHAVERKKWAKLLSEWKPVLKDGKIPALRTGAKKAGEVWCSICMSPMKQGQKLCEVCGAQSEAA
ncbi:MAG TPA: cyclic nucleotide-binding domain-containing protein [Bdellovibrionota bacterium]|nr:cyclic nucleotide-binding domain-containing protein [Bdellovibrionota bacterium]